MVDGSSRLGALFRITLPLTVRLDSFIGQYTVDWQHLFGASVVATIPVFLLFALIEGRVVGGLTAGSVK
jgi:multiple sugar transport system permease protein